MGQVGKNGSEPWFRMFEFKEFLLDKAFAQLDLDLQGLLVRMWASEMSKIPLPSDYKDLAKTVDRHHSNVKRLMPGVLKYFLVQGDWLVSRREMPGIIPHRPKVTKAPEGKAASTQEGTLDNPASTLGVPSVQALETQGEVDLNQGSAPIEPSVNSDLQQSKANHFNDNDHYIVTSTKTKTKAKTPESQIESVDSLLSLISLEARETFRELCNVFEGKCSHLVSCANAFVEVMKRGVEPADLLGAARIYREGFMPPNNKPGSTIFMTKLEKWLKEEGYRAPHPKRQPLRTTARLEKLGCDSFSSELEEAFDLTKPSPAPSCDASSCED